MCRLRRKLYAFNSSKRNVTEDPSAKAETVYYYILNEEIN